MKRTVSAIVCAYNEERTIKPILEALLDHSKILEVIVVDDGSNDKTSKILRSLHHQRLKIISHRKNIGKGAAAADGVMVAKGNIILFVDADLKKLRAEHIDILITPLDIDPLCMTIGVRECPRAIDKTMLLLMKPFGGERAMRKTFVLSLLEKIRKSGYGMEMIFNIAMLKQKHRIYYVYLPKLIHCLKTEKRTVLEVIKETWREQSEMLRQVLDIDNLNAQLPTLQEILKKLR